ncbi:MarR family winged helix-turn-helix transcriptional regulator [Rathayibacter soli]|uniref:MarR family winged helix-turn-helix transcriptional regulator n=1 Tax=Rathayibacter soli TaxID=3144168 RepID=UPI0027E49A99|nr:MarR family transcriptional regulator [Glaciibacter superstes]
MSDGSLGTRFRSADESPGLALWHVTNRWQAAMRATLAPHGLTHVQYVLLACLVWLHDAEPDRQLTQADLAEFAGTDVMMTSQVLRTLETKGLISRAHHPTDGRARVLLPTASGIAIARHATHDVEDADAVFFAPVEDMRAFAAELTHLARQ